MPDAGNVLLVGVLNLKMYALWGAPLTRANGYINCSNLNVCKHGGFCTSVQLICFFLGDLLKHGETWEYLGSPKNILEYSGLKTIEDHSGPMATSGPSSHKMAEIYSILNILKCMHCRGYQ